MVETKNMDLKLPAMEPVLEQILLVELVNIDKAKRVFRKKHLDWEWGQGSLAELHWVLEEPWQHMAPYTNTRSSKACFLEGEDTDTLVDMTRIGMMMIGTAAGGEIEAMADHLKMIIIETIMKEMSATKAALPTPTVSGVSVTVTTGIPRSGAGVKVTGEEFHKHKSNNTDQQPLIHSSPAALPWTA